jgi:hypothetical protein
MSNKKIQINLDSFHVNKNSKTRKNREKKERPIIKPLISPNILKNKLLKRIKEHKNKEINSHEETIKGGDINQKNTQDRMSDSLKPSLVDKNDDDILKYNDEFNDSMNYLQTLTKQKKIDQEKENYEKNKQKRLAELQRKTIKNYNNIVNNDSFSNNISLDLPDSLKEEFVPLNTQQLTINMETPFYLNKKHNATPPYGILKGGSKPTYRDWNKTQKNFVVTDPNSAVIADSKELTNREKRLQILREKIKIKQLEDKTKQKEKLNIINTPSNIQNNNENQINKNLINEDVIMKQNLIRPNINAETVFENNNNNNNNLFGELELYNKENINTQQNIIGQENINTQQNIIGQENINTHEDKSENSFREKIVGIKRKTKKTIKRRYTLGKSKIKKTVAILLKDQQTRKRIITAHRDLKKKGMNDVRKYLREHNLIKLGSNAPNDVLRKLYESAMLTGEITNTNKDTLIHNFLSEDLTN